MKVKSFNFALNGSYTTPNIRVLDCFWELTKKWRECWSNGELIVYLLMRALLLLSQFRERELLLRPFVTLSGSVFLSALPFSAGSLLGDSYPYIVGYSISDPAACHAATGQKGSKVGSLSTDRSDQKWEKCFVFSTVLCMREEIQKKSQLSLGN